MFNELTEKEMYEIEGGSLGGVILLIVGIIFIAGSLKGCTDEAAK